MRTSLSASRRRPVKAIASIAAYLALVTLVVTLFTTNGLLAAATGTLTIGLLVGSYLLERWARRRTLYAADHRPSPTGPDATTTERHADIDASCMAKV